MTLLSSVAAVSSFWFFFHGKTFKLSGKENGIWLAHHWVENKPDEMKIKNLAENLKNSGVMHVFQHAGPLDSTGRIHPSKYAYSLEFIYLLKKHHPEIISVQAWIGQIEKRGGGTLDITSVEIRRNIARTASELINAGFDGIHIDIEPIFDGDSSFLLLLDEIRETLGGRILITCATPKISLGKLFGESLKLFFSVKGLWSEEYYRNISEKSDFTVAMLYDTRIKNPQIYTLFISLEVEKLTKTVKKPIMIGIPSYEDIKPSFNPEIENVGSALDAVFTGLKYCDRSKYRGFSIYADWTMDEEEWNIIKEHVESEKLYE